MISAHIAHQQAFQDLEQQLLEAERAVWRDIREYGIEQWLLNLPETTQYDSNTVMTVNFDWALADFPVAQCGPLFGLNVGAVDDSSIQLQLSLEWHVCCDSQLLCLTSVFTRQRRLWSRQAMHEMMLRSVAV